MHFEKYEYAHSALTNEAYIFVHGFPGLFTKNQDLAVFLSSRMKADCYVPYTRGIGQSSGEFLFTTAIQEWAAFVETIQASYRYSKVSIIAHSWGAFVAICLLARLQKSVNSLVLLSPLTTIPEWHLLEDDLDAVVQARLDTGHSASLSRLAQDVELLRRDYLPQVQKTNFGRWPRTLVIQALGDQTTPVTLARQYFEDKTDSISYVEIEGDHWLTDRSTVTRLMLGFLNRS